VRDAVSASFRANEACPASSADALATIIDASPAIPALKPLDVSLEIVSWVAWKRPS